jgi:hypothetical protein
MFGRNENSDKTLLKSIQRRLERAGSSNRLNATVRQGTVTLTGQLQYEKQRLQITNAIKGVSGVRQVLDQLKSPPKAKPHAAYNAVAAAVAAAVRSQPKSVAPTTNEQEVMVTEVAEESVSDASQDEVA